MPATPRPHALSLCGRFLPRICAIYQQVALLGRATPQAVSLLLRSSPASVAGRIDVPTLLIQGETDSLFGLDQANGNYQAIRRNGAPVDMVWFAGGHDGGNQETSRIDQLTADWFQRWLKPRHLLPRPGSPGGSRARAPSTGQPAFAVTRDLGFDPSSGSDVLGIATALRYPGLAGTRRTMVRLSGRAQTIINPPGGTPPSLSVLPGLSTGGRWTELARHARPERRVHLGTAGRAGAADRLRHGPDPGQRRRGHHAVRQGVRRGPGR